MKKIIILIVLLFLTKVISAQKITNSEEAIKVALEYSGFSQLGMSTSKLEISTQQLIISDDQTPFLKDKINGKKLWQIKLDAIELKLDKYDKSLTNRVIRNFLIYIDPETGTLIKISSELENDYENKPPKPTAERAEKVLSEIQETYHGFPDSVLPISFFDALHFCLGDPITAKEIHAILVLHSKMGSNPRPVWIIDIRGIDQPMIPSGGPKNISHIPIEHRNHIRNAVDAITGKHIFSTTMPQGGEKINYNK